MAWTKGFDCRNTSGFVTDPADCTYVTTADVYPVTRNGVTFGLVAGALGSVNGDSGLDPRIAGCIFSDIGDGGTFDLRVDLPAEGDYMMGLGIGKHNEDPGAQDFKVRDNTTELWSVTGTPTQAVFLDAQGNTYAGATWPGSNVPRLATFATTTLILRCTTSAYRASLAHLLVDQVVADPPIRNRRLSTQQRMVA